jgi:DNA polymerase-1
MVTKTYENKPDWKFIVRPSLDVAINTLQKLRCEAEVSPNEVWIDFDIETRYGHIDCIGLSWSRTEAICIPLIARGKPEGYWSAEEEAHVVYQIYKLLSHKNVRVRWQNGLYDAQYVQRHWHFIPHGGQDTMITQHSLFCALPKGLGFIASMYCDWYVYWKDEGKIASDVPEEQRWTYNLQDCIYTRESGEVLLRAASAMKLGEVDKVQQSLFMPVLKAMITGVRIDPATKNQMALDIQEELSHREAFLYNILGHTINPASPKQMQALFYDDLKQPIIYKRVVANGKTVMNPTCDDEALTKLAAKEPLIRPICNAIADIRTLHKFYGDFVMMPLDQDGRMRCSFNIAGDAGGKSAPYSYRLSSSKNPFGSGGNLQTIPSEKSKSSGKAAARGSMDFRLPNIKSMYVPDKGFTFFDMDLDRADLQIVVRESGEADWIAALKQGVDMHLLNAFIIAKKEPPPAEELVESHPRYPDHRGPLKHAREFAKVFAHATNYGGGAKTVAAHTGRTVQEIDAAQRYWFGAHPGIKQWHERTFDQINRHRFVENKWGYKWFIFDRLEAMLPEALAWVPQSTVGILINKIWASFYENIPELQVLLQVHDSLAGQFPTHRSAHILPLMEQHSKIVIPYDDPLIIPTGVKTSTVSWGDC